MNNQNLQSLFSGKIFCVPDYQRGYAWEEKQLNDLISDIDALVNEEVQGNHYAGTIVTYRQKSDEYNRRQVDVFDVVDGQQRLTSICLYLSVIIRKLVENGETAYKEDESTFLFNGQTCILTLNNETDRLFYQLITNGVPRDTPTTPHQQRLLRAIEMFSSHIEKKLSANGVDYLKKLFKVITFRVDVTHYTIASECEIGMTFELMNSRGKNLSTLELLKNYLMYWVSRNIEKNEQKDLTKKVNDAWRDTYKNLGESNGNDDQCLRIAWVLYFSHVLKEWKGYDGFKSNQYIPIRDFSKKTKEQVKATIVAFVDGLATVSKHYSAIILPSRHPDDKEEREWLINIHNTGNVANFLPLLVAARIAFTSSPPRVTKEQYLGLLKALELFSFRVFLFAGKRGNAGKSNFYRWGKELFGKERSITEITNDIYKLVCYYSSDDTFKEGINKPSNWYSRRNLLKYSLFEYEKHLLHEEGGHQNLRIDWSELSEESIEHILPQTPDEKSHWLQIWRDEDIKTYLHDIGNLVLTRDNSSYSNFEFDRKKGSVGDSVGYSNSDIRQERKIAAFDDWDTSALERRREDLVTWMITRWKTEKIETFADIDESDDEEPVSDG